MHAHMSSHKESGALSRGGVGVWEGAFEMSAMLMVKRVFEL